MIQQPFETAAQTHLRLGKIDGEQTMLLRLLQSKFGTLNEKVQRRILDQNDVQVLEEWFDRILQAQTLAATGLI